MRSSQKTTTVDRIVILGCMAFAALTLGAAGEGGRRRAKEWVCQSNLRQWGAFFQSYIERNDGKFYTGCNRNGYWWPLQLPPDQQDWKVNRTWFCPTATRPSYDEAGMTLPTDGIFTAWGVYTAPGSMTYEGRTYTMGPNGISGSYALNGYLLDIPDDASYERGAPAADGWRELGEVADAADVPVFLDALRFDLWPEDTDVPPESEARAGSGSHLARCCINRHDGAVNCLFLDGSVRKVGLKELWTLKWHQSFKTDGAWTQAGGVMPTDWPQWMSQFKDY